MRKKWEFPIGVGLAGLGLIGLTYVVTQCDPRPRFEASKLQLLTLKLENKYKREIDINNYSLHYVSRDPDTVVIKVRFRSNANQNVLGPLLDSAQELVRRTAREDFGISYVNVIVDMKPVLQSSESENDDQ